MKGILRCMHIIVVVWYMLEAQIEALAVVKAECSFVMTFVRLIIVRGSGGVVRTRLLLALKYALFLV